MLPHRSQRPLGSQPPWRKPSNGDPETVGDPVPRSNTLRLLTHTHTTDEDEVYDRPRPKKGKPSHTRAYSEDADDAEEDDPGHLESQSVLPPLSSPIGQGTLIRPQGISTNHQSTGEEASRCGAQW